MTPQERDLPTMLFDRLTPVERNPEDEEADKFIAHAVAAQPSGAVLHGAAPADAGSGVTLRRNCDLRPRVVL